MKKIDKVDFIKIENTCFLEKTLLEEWKYTLETGRKYFQNTKEFLKQLLITKSNQQPKF